MKVQRQRDMYLTVEEFSTALREYLKARGEDMVDYPKGPIAYQQDGEWRLHFYAEACPCTVRLQPNA